MADPEIHPAQDSRHRMLACIKGDEGKTVLIAGRKLRVTKEGLDAILNNAPLPPSVKPYHPFPHPIDDIISPVPPAVGQEDYDPTRKVGRNLTGKQKPQHGMAAIGPDPLQQRRFLGEEFPGMMTFDGKGAPSLLSRFPEAKGWQDIREIRINIATALPEYMTGTHSQALKVQAMEDEAFGSKTLPEVFTPAPKKMIDQIRKYARDFEETYGIRITVGHDLPDAHVCLMGYQSRNQNLLGFASFPPGVNDWPEMDWLGDHPAYMLLNSRYMDAASGKDCYDLFAHEFGHTLGMVHSHDAAILDMSARESMTATKMAYSDLNIQAFRHLITDGEGKPLLTAQNHKQYYSAGVDEGVLDYALRQWVSHPPMLGSVTQPDPALPDCDAYKGVFDLQVHHDLALRANKDALTFRYERLLPMVAMVNNGEHSVLRGTKGDDLLDCNPGYNSTVGNPAKEIEQHFNLIEGHFGKVFGVAGNNTIIAAQKGDQEIHPGPGHNQVEFLYSDFSGHKKVVSEGPDVVVLTTDILSEPGLKKQDGPQGQLYLENARGSIALEGRGRSIKIITPEGRHVTTLAAQEATAANLDKSMATYRTLTGAKETNPYRPPVQPLPESAMRWQDRIAAAQPRERIR